MSDVVIAALIGAIASIAVNLIALSQQSKRRAVEEAVKEARLEGRLKSIEAKLDLHNGYSDKIESIQKDMGNVAVDIAVIKTDLQMLKHA